MTVCVLCPFECVSCSSASVCSSCQSGFYLRADNFCYSTCLDGFFYNNETNTCYNCSLNCTLCFSPSFCMACSAFYYLTPNNSCVDSTACPIRYYPNNDTNICELCLYDCLTCADNVTCSSCDYATDRRVFDANSSRCIAAPGYFDIGNTVCVLCPPECTTC